MSSSLWRRSLAEEYVTVLGFVVANATRGGNQMKRLGVAETIDFFRR
jgi:hypothetical protein